MEFADSKAFFTELLLALKQCNEKKNRDSLRWLNRCLEGRRFVPDSGRHLRVDNWDRGRTTTLMRVERTEENESAISSLRQFQMDVKAVLESDTEDFEGEYSEVGTYAKSRIWTTVQLLNPIDSSSYTVSHILPLEVRLRLGID